MATRLRSNFLHPNYNNYYGSPLNNQFTLPTSISHRYGSLQRRPRMYEQPPLSPYSTGLTEVLSSYTPGPTVIMIEKKKKPTCMQNKLFRAICIIMLVLGTIFWLGSALLSKHENYAPLVARTERTVMGRNQSDNLTGYSYITPHFKYANVILSLDEDDESFVEDIQTYSILHY